MREARVIVPPMAKKNGKPTIGFIGQGYVGKNYGDDFERRGFRVVRYSLEKQYIHNKNKIKECDIVFVAVWTPTTPKGFDPSIVESVLHLIHPGTLVVLKSTIVPGTTIRLQKKFPKLTIMYSPEFLSVGTAADDARHPFSNIIGIPKNDARHRAAAKRVLSILPKAPFTSVVTSTEAEIIKYSHNMSGYTQIMIFNMLYEVATKLGGSWDVVHKALLADPYICNRYSQPLHKGGRGAGGGCFIKDFAAFRMLYKKALPQNKESLDALMALEKKNIQLLTSTYKDLELLSGVYGADVVKRARKKTR